MAPLLPERWVVLCLPEPLSNRPPVTAPRTDSGYTRPHSAVKGRLIGAYRGHRRTAVISVDPLTRAQLEKGSGRELMMVNRNHQARAGWGQD